MPIGPIPDKWPVSTFQGLSSSTSLKRGEMADASRRHHLGNWSFDLENAHSGCQAFAAGYHFERH